MTTAQSPVDILRAALERIVRGMDQWPVMEAKRVFDIARTALAEAAALAAEVPVDEHPIANLLRAQRAAAPPPVPVPGGMRDEVFREAARFLDVLEHHENSGGQQGVNIRYGITLAARHLRKYADRLAAATPPEIVVGMPTLPPALPVCPRCGGYATPNGGCLTVDCRPSPATPPVQQQGEAGAVCGRMVWGALGFTPCTLPPHDPATACVVAAGNTLTSQITTHFVVPRTRTPEAPTPPLGKGETCKACGGSGNEATWSGVNVGICTACNGTGSRPPTDSQGGGK